MEFLRTVICEIKDNRKDILAVSLLFLTVVLILCSFTFSTLAPQEGWYSIYIRNILQEGLVPYKDFPLVVPPFSLYLYTIWQIIFGDNFVVFHYLNILFQAIFVISFYSLFRQIFNIKISAIITLFLAASKIFVEFDNGVASYNTLAMAFMAIMALFTIKQVNFINTYKKISTKWLWWIGFIFAVSFLNKQTTGALTIMASCLLLTISAVKTLGIKQAAKHFLYLFLISVLFVFLFTLPLLIAGALPAMIDNIFRGGSKGSFSILLKNLLSPFPVNLWFYYVLIFVGSFILLPKSKHFVMGKREDKGDLNKFFLIFVLVFFIVFLTVTNISFDNNPLFHKLWGLCSDLSSVFEPVSLLFALILLVYLMYSSIKSTISHRRLNLLIIILLFFSGNISDLLSNGFHYPLFVCLCLGLFLLWIWKKFNILKNIILIGIFVFIIIINFSYKLWAPMCFWGWQSGSVFDKLESSYIPRLKGMKLPAEEKQMYEEIYNIVHEYTNENDVILAFNNNQVFYDLTERKPYTKYISLYHDVSPENQPLEVLENLKKDLPKVIIFLRFSDDIEQFHEDSYRGHISGQRMLRDYIDSLIKEGKYYSVKKYEQMKILDVSKMPKSLQDKYNKTEELSSEERQYLLGAVHPYLKVENKFLQSGCTLSVLVRSDIYKKG